MAEALTVPPVVVKDAHPSVHLAAVPAVRMRWLARGARVPENSLPVPAVVLSESVFVVAAESVGGVRFIQICEHEFHLNASAIGDVRNETAPINNFCVAYRAKQKHR
jgi:hypothetical protein